MPDYTAQINHILSDTDNLVTQVQNGSVTVAQGYSSLLTIQKSWDDFKFSQPKSELDSLIHQELYVLSPKWDAATNQIAKVQNSLVEESIQSGNGGAIQQNSSSQNGSQQEIIVVGIALFVILFLID